MCVCVSRPGGALSGKYLTDSPDPKARFNLFKGYMERYNKSLARVATEEYVKIAQKYDLTPTQLALAWCRWVCLRSCGAGAGCTCVVGTKGTGGRPRRPGLSAACMLIKLCLSQPGYMYIGRAGL